MPQMAPMNWIMLFFMFSIIFMLFNVMNYFSFKYNNLSPKQLNNPLYHKLSWKW
uniref:ATP synthase complex subunit 8 n=1 Tax=Ochthebius himalayae TaxID=1309160 RepID=A0A7H0DKE8_9COLE|nr:ATP synthase F0 subunit 8 [Ochthebius himalayae]QNP09808.1 ATP synthase F0 subunit 8 [Ochthebius himalayae]